ncbi:MAG: SDR family NAD(P)-dependent oxidoreductase [Rickettsiaceae bacterium]
MNTTFRSLLLICFFVITNQVQADTVLITDANRGIGFALTKLYLKSGYTVYATYLSTTKSAELLEIKNPALITIKVDIAKEDSDKIIKQIVKDKPIDILIHNAALFAHKANRGPVLDMNEWVDSFKVNTIAPIKISWYLKENLIKSNQKKIIAISSRRGSNTVNIQDHYEGRYAYRSSKAALNSSMIALAQDFSNVAITVLMIHPGRVATKMTGFDGISPNQSAINIKHIVDKATLDQTGLFFDAGNGKIINW